MKNLSQEMKRQRDKEARLRQSDPLKGIIYTGDGSIGAGGGGYTPNPANVLDKTAHDLLDHAGLTGIPLLSSLRQEYIGTDTVVVNHNFGRRPLVQVIGGAGPLYYGTGNYGAGDYGGGVDREVLTPSSIVHDTVNKATVTLAATDTGEVICIG